MPIDPDKGMLEGKTPTEYLVDMMGRDSYERTWNQLPWYSKWWYTLRGQAPGGRKGAPPLRQPPEKGA